MNRPISLRDSEFEEAYYNYINNKYITSKYDLPPLPPPLMIPRPTCTSGGLLSMGVWDSEETASVQEQMN